MKPLFVGLVGFAILTALYFYRGRLMTGSAGHSATARNVADIHDIAVGLHVGSEDLLFVLVGADGSINRIGSGTFKNKNRDMFIGMTDPVIFQRVRSHLTDSIMQGLGMGFRRENPLGAPCKLTIIIRFNDGKSASSEYLYGAESEGPPSEVADFVRAAVRETEGWYQQQLRMVEKPSP
jgi:hypothetical protein